MVAFQVIPRFIFEMWVCEIRTGVSYWKIVMISRLHIFSWYWISLAIEMPLDSIPRSQCLEMLSISGKYGFPLVIVSWEWDKYHNKYMKNKFLNSNSTSNSSKALYMQIILCSLHWGFRKCFKKCVNSECKPVCFLKLFNICFWTRPW